MKTFAGSFSFLPTGSFPTSFASGVASLSFTAWALRLRDVGCANGGLSVELAGRGHQVIGVDFEPKRLAKARQLAERLRSSARFEQTDMRDLVAQGRFFDLIVLGEVCDSFVERVEFLRQLQPLLAPGASARCCLNCCDSKSLQLQRRLRIVSRKVGEAA